MKTKIAFCIFMLNIKILAMESSPEIEKILQRVRYHLEKDNSVVKKIIIQRQLDEWDEQELGFNRLKQAIRDNPEILKKLYEKPK
ncbi:hypothetical protein A3F66_04385 [candidate division TM6 bacterium RIFCSPHIGHO2_12_FULL_32_22]|nr:MAG: hypothetical protein A3F66_04385 [candidate division TM6 bacterium RIFCSPHIGHO2_12_FULL_32_22]